MKRKLIFLSILLFLSVFAFSDDWSRTVVRKIGNISYSEFDMKAKDKNTTIKLLEPMGHVLYVDFIGNNHTSLTKEFIDYCDSSIKKKESQIRAGDTFVFMSNLHKGSETFFVLYTQKRKNKEGKYYYKHYMYESRVR